MPDDTLQHFGVLGMRWGRRKAQPSGSSDHSRAAAIRAKKPGEVISDKEIATYEKRKNLEDSLKNAARVSGVKPPKKTEDMSNDEIQSYLQKAADAYVAKREKSKSFVNAKMEEPAPPTVKDYAKTVAVGLVGTYAAIVAANFVVDKVLWATGAYDKI